MADVPGLPEIRRTLDRHERTFLRTDVYQAERDADRARLTAVETKLNSTWLSNRNALLAVTSVIAGLIVSTYLNIKGG